MFHPQFTRTSKHDIESHIHAYTLEVSKISKVRSLIFFFFLSGTKLIDEEVTYNFNFAFDSVTSAARERRGKSFSPPRPRWNFLRVPIINSPRYSSIRDTNGEVITRTKCWYKANKMVGLSRHTTRPFILAWKYIALTSGLERMGSIDRINASVKRWIDVTIRAFFFPSPHPFVTIHRNFLAEILRFTFFTDGSTCEFCAANWRSIKFAASVIVHYCVKVIKNSSFIPFDFVLRPNRIFHC